MAARARELSNDRSYASEHPHVTSRGDGDVLAQKKSSARTLSAGRAAPLFLERRFLSKHEDSRRRAIIAGLRSFGCEGRSGIKATHSITRAIAASLNERTTGKGEKGNCPHSGNCLHPVRTHARRIRMHLPNAIEKTPLPFGPPRRCPCNVERSISLHIYPSDESCGSAVSSGSNALPQRVTCRSSTAAQLAERSVPAEWHGKLQRFFRDHARTPIKSNSPSGHCGRYLKQLPSRPANSASLTSCGRPSDLEALGLKTWFLDVIEL